MKNAEFAFGHSGAADQVFQRLFGAVSDAVVWAMPDTGRILCCNSAAERLFQKSRPDLIGTLLREVYPRGDADPWVGLLAQTATGSRHGPLEGEVSTSTGRVVTVRVFTSLVETGNRLLIQGVFQDAGSLGEVDRTPGMAKSILVQRNRELESLAAITHRASRSLDLDHLLETLLPEIARVLDVRPVLLFLSDGESSLTLRGSFPPAGDAGHEEAELRMGECLCGLAAEGGMRVFSEDIANDPRVTRDACEKTGLASVAAIPLQSAHNRTGVLAVASTSRRDFRRNEYFLSAIADSLATAIENADLYQEIKVHAAVLEQRVAERTAQLETANKELEAFSYTVSHDLRAPLRSIDGFSKSLEEEHGHALNQEGKDYLRRVRDAAHRMRQLIDDLLKLSKLTRGEFRREHVDLGALARTVASQLEKSAGERPVDFVIGEGMSAWGDPRLLLVVLENLIQNAWKFSVLRPKARIEVGMVEFTGRKAYFVRDNGVGFNPAQADRLFQPFQRLHPASEYPGSGIGLATVKRIVHRHGGKVWIEAEQGVGTTVYFTL